MLGSLCFVGISYANPNLSVEEKKIVLDYKHTLESHIARKLQFIDGGDGAIIKVKLKTILSSEKIKNLNKDFLLPISAIGGPSFNKIFVDKLDVKVTTLNELTAKNKRIAINEISEISNIKSPNITFRINSNSVSDHMILAYAGLGGVFIVISLIFLWARRKDTKEDNNGELNDDENVELELMLDRLAVNLKRNSMLLNDYMNSHEYDLSGFSTLVLYLDMKFPKEDLFDHENLRKLSHCSVFYTSREFKIWLGAILNTLDLKAGIAEDTVEIKSVFDFKILDSSSTEHLQTVLIDLTDKELSIFFNSVPNKLKFKMIEALRENRGSDMDTLLSDEISGRSHMKDLELLSKVEKKIEKLQKMNHKENTNNAA
jgi:hypothetical protein